MHLSAGGDFGGSCWCSATRLRALRDEHLRLLGDPPHAAPAAGAVEPGLPPELRRLHLPPRLDRDRRRPRVRAPGPPPEPRRPRLGRCPHRRLRGVRLRGARAAPYGGAPEGLGPGAGRGSGAGEEGGQEGGVGVARAAGRCDDFPRRLRVRAAGKTQCMYAWASCMRMHA